MSRDKPVIPHNLQILLKKLGPRMISEIIDFRLGASLKKHSQMPGYNLHTESEATPTHSLITDNRALVTSRSRLSRLHWWMIFLGHSVLLVALALSLSWNVRQARENERNIETAFRVGYRAGQFTAALQQQLDEVDQQQPAPEDEKFTHL